MKLRTLERFEDAIAAESGWRRKELTTLRHEAASARSHAEGMMVRAGTALLYAHWEGFVKAASELYVEFVKQKKLKYIELSTPFFAMALKSKMNALAEANAAAVHNAFAESIRQELGSRAPLSSNLIDTGANLSSQRFKDIIGRLGLDYTPYELREQLIDVRLLATRNAVAHGQSDQASLADYLDLHRQVERLISEYREDILSAARAAAYRR